MDKILLSTKDAIHVTFPFKKVSRKQAQMIINPWMTKEILEEQKSRDILKKTWIKSGHIPNSPEHISYKTCRNKIVTMIRNARRNYIYSDCEKANGDGKKVWKAIKKAMNIKPKPDITPNFVKTGVVGDDTIPQKN